MERDNTIDTVQVALRIRPLVSTETRKRCEDCVEVVSESQVVIKDIPFSYNFVFPKHITQLELYDTAVKRLVEKLFQGYNVTILAYGQTGSGKTYTMGTNYSGSRGDSTELGIIPQAVADIFELIERNHNEFIFKVNVSYIELYQEQCYDLLSDKPRNHKILEIREDVNRAIVLPGMTEIPVTTKRQTMMALARGTSGRVTGCTSMNQASSRSHAVFTIVITKESRSNKNIATTSKFHLVDLAGSERIKKTKATGERLKEAVNINKGLLALGNVISALGDGTNRSFISYRDSKLTRLLQDSLGGNSFTLMVACVSPADYNLDETVSTLRYADRVRRIRNKPVINQDARAAEIVRLNKLVNDLRLQIVDKTPTVTEQNNNEKLQEDLDRDKIKYSEILKKHKKVTEHLNNMFIENIKLCEKALLVEAAKDKIKRKLNELTEQCDQTIGNLKMPEGSQDDNANINSVVDYLKEVKSRLEDLQSVNLKTDQELIEHELKLPTVKEESVGDKEDEVEVLNEDQVVLEEEKRTMLQVALSQELQQLNRDMAIKACLIQGILDKTELLDSIKKKNEEKISILEKERDELLQQLQGIKTKKPSHEERRTKVLALESEIIDLKNKCQQQTNIIEAKENETKIATLNAEIQTMKATKVKIIRQMREESEKFRKWKAVNEQALQKLRAAATEKMEAKQQNLLRRTMEGTVAVNKRLKEALDRQKESVMKRNPETATTSSDDSVKTEAVQQYIVQELEVNLSVVEAEQSLEELMEYRAWRTEQIETLCDSTDETHTEKIAEIKDDLALRKAQISDLQEKILTADQENKSQIQWDYIQSMEEAKVALKYLFDLLVDAKREIQNQSEKGFQARYEEVKESYDRLLLESENSKTELEQELASVKLQKEQEVSALVALHQDIVNRGEKCEVCKVMQSVMQRQQEKLELMEQENIKLVDELEKLRNAGIDDLHRKVENTEDDCEDLQKDPDWPATPFCKRIKAQRSSLRMKLTSDESDASTSAAAQATVKREVVDWEYCICRGYCSTKICSCVRSQKDCGGTCKCKQELCVNKHPRVGPETPSSTEHFRHPTPLFPDRRQPRNAPANVKKRNYFFP